MRDDSTPLRGESGRIAARVRQLVDEGFAGGPAGPRHAPLTERLPPLSEQPSPFSERPSPFSEQLAPLSEQPSPLSQRPSSPAERPSLAARLAARLPVRVDPGRRAPIAIGIAVLLAAVLTGLWVLSAKPRAVALSAAASDAAAPVAPDASLGAQFPPVGSVSPAGPPPSTVGTSSAAEVVVDVAGRVRRPGLYHLPPGSRVDDAISAAGGARRGVRLTNLNLAALLVDGEQIIVGPGAAAVGGPPGAPAAPAASSAAVPVPLNSATLEQLETLPGVGPVTAQKILDYRAAHGSFSAIDQLKDVSGIGDVTFAELEPLVTL